MVSRGGVAYVYLCYGIHAMFNIITNREGIPHAVLIRAVEPTHGVAFMLERRRMRTPERRLTAGPGALTEALGITTEDNGTPLSGNRIWIEAGGPRTPAQEIVEIPRVGIGYAVNVLVGG